MLSCVHQPIQKTGSPEQMLPRIHFLREKHPNVNFSHVLLDTQKMHKYLWRKSRWSVFKVGIWANMPCATCNPSNFAVALAYCIKNGITKLCGGHNVMMSVYPYQHPMSIEKTGEFCQEYGVKMDVPVFWYQNEDVMFLYQFKEFKNNQDFQ